MEAFVTVFSISAAVGWTYYFYRWMKENLDVFGLNISDDDMSILSCLPERGFSGEHPDLERINAKGSF